MTYLTPAEYPAVRAAIDISLGPRSLPDGVIGLPTYAGEAELWVLATSPESATYTPGSAQWQKAQVAAIMACAALLYPSIPILTSETYGSDYRYARSEVDAEKAARALWDRARTALADAAGDPTPTPSKAPSRFIFGRVAGNRRRGR